MIKLLMVQALQRNNDREHDQLVELRSLGVEPKRRSEFNDEQELEKLAENIKQSMLQDYRTAYGRRGNEFEQESMSTVNP
jgi:hypothetical protein